MKISIFAPTEHHQTLASVLNKEEALKEWVALKDSRQERLPEAAGSLLVEGASIRIPADWTNQQPPVLYPESVAYTEETLLGLLFARTGDYAKAYACFQDHPYLLWCTDLLNRLESQVLFPEDFPENLPFPGNPHPEITAHNLAVSFHYGIWENAPDFETIANLYDRVIQENPNGLTTAFSVKHYAALLADAGKLDESQLLLEKWLGEALPEEAKYGLQTVLCGVLIDKIRVPYDPVLLEKLKPLLMDCLQYLEAKGRATEAALLLMDAAHIANISNSFAESLGYLSKALSIFQSEGQEELVATAQLKKGILLSTWAQNGQPQFYKAAMDSFLAALKTFKRETAPDIFADIHHHLGIIYAEIPDEIKKKSIWAAVSVASFNEALNFYNKVEYPYEFAMICHHYGNAYTKYPAALHSDNFDKALAWYREALDIRTAEHYPLERCHTLFNYLEASWQAGNPTEGFQEERYQDMRQKAQELLALSADPLLKKEAAAHLEQLESLKITAD